MAMPSNKAPGFDKVPLFVVKDCLAHILPAISNIINSSLANPIFPRAWKRAEVVPHLKDDLQAYLPTTSPFQGC